MRRKTCSVILSVYNEELNLPIVYRALAGVATQETSLDWEFIFVNDGSQDDSLRVLRRLHDADSRVKVVSFSRNFGAHETTAAGLHHCSGDMAVIMGADMQDPPAVISRFLDEWRRSVPVVLGIRTSRKDSTWRCIAARLFNSLLRRIALPNMPLRGTGSFCLIDRKVINAYNSLSESSPITFALILWLGFTYSQIEYHRPERHSGVSKYTLGKQVKAAVDTILSFSTAPVRWISIAGGMLSLLGMLFAAWIVIHWFIHGNEVLGWPSLMATILVLGGSQLAVLGLLGEYQARIFDEVRRRPPYIVDETLGDLSRHGEPLSQTVSKAA